MVGNQTHVHGSDPPRRAVTDINDPEFAHFRYRRQRQTDIETGADEPAPLFLSSQTDEHDADWDAPPAIPRPRLRIGLLAASAIALVAAAVITPLFVGSLRDAIQSARTALIGVSPTQTRAEVAAALRGSGAKEPSPPPAAAGPPTRADIAAAYQEAIKGQVVARDAPAAAPPAEPPPPAAAAAPPPRRLDPDAVAALLKRANSLLAIGDVAPARLLLERAADGQDADAALLLARTYDPDVLAAVDKRSITPDPEMARFWYRKAAELGSQQAQQRLSQLQN
ncbi:SEL1-like repeat protein [Bradyrhizobium lablabi]|uniref:SEL1-like repeat protein n=1 Tax=Bradyrhizobium lablabi TaxID=722472 RepID=UPI001BAC9192|nr:SEL1-like repeat protein [Bradyrhizobium lablabi]MBR0695311.1 SEL1-like repeat protein [Bradyrhizobium lablabi]